MTTLLAQIVDWSKDSLKPWQQDAIRRIFQNTLDTAAIDTLYGMLKKEHGISSNDVPAAVGLDHVHIPAAAPKAASARLVALKEVRDVNRLAAGQVLKFSPIGMTIIYGGNGAGKSGYARILKRACRSRDADYDILPNVSTKASATATPAATFEIELGGSVSSIPWNKNASAPAALSTIAVFDTNCARAYLDQAQEVAYTPYGLDVVEKLAALLPTLETKINDEVQQIDVSKDALKPLEGTTKVGMLIGQLSHKTLISEVEDLAELQDAEVEELARLESALKEPDPTTVALQIRHFKDRVTELRSALETALTAVGDAALEGYSTLDAETELAIFAESQAAEALRKGGDNLQGTGSNVWKTLFEAARKYANEEAYKGYRFPVAPVDGHCVLCQQSLTSEATERLSRFDAYVQADVSAQAKSKRTERTDALSTLTTLVLKVSSKAILDELDVRIPEISKGILLYEQSLETRRTWMRNAFNSHDWQNAPKVVANPLDRLADLVTSLELQASSLQAASDPQKKKELQAQADELNARVKLEVQQNAVVALIERMRKREALIKCKGDLQTRPISSKAKNLATAAVTEPLRIALQQEFEALGVAAMMPRLDEAVARGKTRHKLALNLDTTKELRDVLSEGEQRAIAIGAFLAELRVGGHEGGVIFDDPVSSLDHFRRQQVARRLVLEAKSRQVVVFTHDTVFLGELRSEMELADVPHLIHYLEWNSGYAGNIIEGLPWDHKKFYERIDTLEKNQREIARSWPHYPGELDEMKMRTQYTLLRATLERAIQDVVFADVVSRYRDWIKVGNLKDVVGFEHSEYLEIDRLHKVCSDVTEAHDKASGHAASVPHPSQLAKDIADLKTVMDLVKNKRKTKSNPLQAAGAAKPSP